MKTPTHYKVLGVSVDASQKEIVQAYRRLAWRVHPDLQPPERKQRAEEVMKWLNEAYAVLDDPETRARYDATIGLRLGPTPRAEKPQERRSANNPTAPLPEEWFTRNPLAELLALMRSTSWRRRTAFARLIFDIVVGGFLLMGAYTLYLEWYSMPIRPVLSEFFCGGLWLFFALWAFLMVIMIVRLFFRR